MRFEVEITDHPPALGFDLPFDPKQELGKVRAPVRVTINGYAFRTTVAAMGGRVFIGMNREVRAGTGVEAGERVEVELVLDEEPRTVELPAELAAALDAEARARSSSRSPSRTARSTSAGSRRRNARKRGGHGSRRRPRCFASGVRHRVDSRLTCVNKHIRGRHGFDVVGSPAELQAEVSGRPR